MRRISVHVNMEAAGSAHPVHLSQDGRQPSRAPHLDTKHTQVKDFLPVLNPGLNIAKALANKAVKMHKVFSIQGPYPVIRAALRARGWVEQHHRCFRQQHQHSESRFSSNDAAYSDDESSDHAEMEQDPDRLHSLMSCLVRNEMVYFYWTNHRDAVSKSTLQKEQMINHFAKVTSFTTKAGLCVNLRNLHWFDSADPDTFFPRCYRLAVKDERHAFIEDYRRTACTSLLKYIVERDRDIGSKGTIRNVQDVQGQKKKNKQGLKQLTLSQLINTALSICQKYLDSLEHRDIDTSREASQTLTQEQWAEFIQSYYLVVHGGAQIKSSSNSVSCCQAMLEKLEQVSPQLSIDGVQNIWIIKPGAMSRGRGIKCAKRLDQILKLVDVDLVLIMDNKWVVQKYIEQPLLVHGTKFDVRQWFLVTDWNPLTVWFYKKCYMRFSTQPFSLDTLDRSVHLCNNSIQKHMRPSQQRHPGIPADNMWQDNQFQAFLASQGQEALWKTVVVPGMKKAVIHALQTAQDLVESRKNTFELYGADFLLGQDLHPWLIEINASPAMAPSTSVTARLCAAVQEDTLRVVLDRRVDRTANTGDFQLIYKQAAVEVPQYIGIDLLLKGYTIKRPCSLPPLTPSHHSAAKRRGLQKDKDPALDKIMPKMLFKRGKVKNNSRKALPSPLPSEPHVLRPAEITLHLPMRAKKPAPFPESHTILSKRRAEVRNVCSDNL
ncbi:tubulin monoglycylase TTLL3 [Nematolebias whitei]|uniref:tubulin monoglycylase TTLL3 n=1 Tax=Nematolebias whitei TaxID=451745 RepID=UPI0018985325|nr:tubulin monoglycylase TTLL3 [Nematolebias whitei]